MPASWVKAGQWRTPGCTVCGNDTISFFALDPAESEALELHLKEFGARLPRRVRQSGNYVSGR